MKRLLLLTSLFAGATAFAQMSLTTLSSATTEDFTGFDGTGFVPAPAAGQLDSDTWRITGMSQGDPVHPDAVFGGNYTTTDYGQGTSSGGVFSGGVYAFDNSGDVFLGIQPTGGDWTPGAITLKLQNNTGSTITSLDISYDIMVNNNEERGNDFHFLHGADTTAMTQVVTADYTTDEVSQGSVLWVTVARSFSVTGLNVAAGEFYYIQWAGADNTGGGSRDEIGIDNLSVTPQGGVVSCTQPNIDPITDMVACDSVQLSTITGTDLTGNQAYYSEMGGTGDMYTEGDYISSSMTLYAYDADGACTEEETFDITINLTPSFDNLPVLSECDSVELEVIIGSNLSGSEAYYTEAGGTGTMMSPGEWLTTDGTIYIYDETGTTPNCSNEMMIIVNILDSLNAGEDHDTTVVPGTLVDLTGIIDEDNGGDFVETTSPASGQFDDVNGVFNTSGLTPGDYTFDYFVGGCYEDTAVITVTVQDTTNSITELTELNLEVYPNPFTNELNITNTFDALSIVDASGRVVYSLNKTQNQINLSFLKSGFYTLIIESKGRIGQMRLVKK